MSETTETGRRLRQFTPAGIAAFRAWLAEARRDRAAPPPLHLLTDAGLTEVVEPAVELDRPGFATKRDAAVYLRRALGPLDPDRVLRNAGLWTWLTLFYLDDVCPPSAGGREVKADYYYVYESDQALYHYRHLLRVSFEVIRRAPDHHRLFLNTPMDKLGGATEKVMRRLFLTRIDAIFEVMDRLYYDEAKGRAKRRIADPRPRPGDLINRLPRRVQQLQRTYDLNVIDADRLLDLLGPEFKRWLADPGLPGLA